MQGIPSATNTDTEDVVWGLQTAEALWKRGEHADAIVWLRRAASAASDAGDDDRALELARSAAELTDWMTNVAVPADPADAAPHSWDMAPADVEETTMIIAAPLPVNALSSSIEDAPTSVDAAPSSVDVVAVAAPRAVPPPLPSRRPPPPLPSRLPRPAVPSRPPPPLPRQIAQMNVEESAPNEAAAAPLELNLDDVEAFADLPDDARADFAAAAVIDDLDEGEEISRFALAYVMDGAFDVAATMVDAPAVRLGKGAVLRARGTTEEGVPMRMICAHGSGRLATWSDAAVDDAFRLAPWVEEELRVSADRIQALVGITIGPLGERIDAAIRDRIVNHLTLRPLVPGEIIVETGSPVPGLVLVGAGQIEIVHDGNVTDTVGSGEFVFPNGVLGASAAPGTARAGVGGALVMFGDRMVAHELLMTCPPLIELLAEHVS
ncbi:MAG: hypothetical protein FWD69_19015 [Polyangiaceae bacterium]|nr:hypothetical protein [Polyangiaceae bacterium]